jgi:hypothetical protein
MRIAIIPFPQGTHALLVVTLGYCTEVTRSAAALTGRCSSQANVPSDEASDEVRRTAETVFGPNGMQSLVGEFYSSRWMRDQQRAM